MFGVEGHAKDADMIRCSCIVLPSNSLRIRVLSVERPIDSGLHSPEPKGVHILPI